MKNTIYYVMLFTVILTWGIDPVINSLFYKHYSATALFSLFSVGAYSFGNDAFRIAGKNESAIRDDSKM